MVALVIALLAAGAAFRPLLSLLRSPPVVPWAPPASPAPDETAGTPPAVPLPPAAPLAVAVSPSADTDLQEASRLFALARNQNDLAQVFLLIRRAAERGNLDGVEGMATMYYNGWGVPQNRDEAIRLWQRAAEQGHVDSQYKVGCAYLEPKASWSGGPAITGFDDWQRGVDWLRRAARAGHAAAQEKLRSMGIEPQ